MATPDKDKLDRVKHHLRGHPLGLTITDLASRLKMNRNLVANYLDMLLISGQVEIRVIGNAKVFSLSHRVPISAMLEFSSDYIVTTDAEQRVIQVNEQFLSFLGEPRDSLVGRRTDEIENCFFRCLPVPGPDKKGTDAQERITETCCEVRGEKFYFRIKEVPTAFEDGTIGETFIIEDITARKVSEENLQISEARYRGIVEDQTEFITRFCPDGSLIFVNESYSRYLGLKPDELMGKFFVPGIIAEDRAVTGHLVRSLGREQPAATMECRILDPSGRIRWNHWTIRPLFNNSGDLREFQAVGRDITETKEAEEKNRKYIAQLEYLARTSAELADMKDDEDIYQYIVDRLAEIEPTTNIVMNSINPETNVSICRAYGGEDKFVQDGLVYHGNPVGSTYQMANVPWALDELSKGRLIRGPDSLYLQAYKMIPEDVCTMIEEKMMLGKFYAMGFTCRGGLYGNVCMRFRKGDDLHNRELAETFIRQAAVALQRRHIREKLLKAETKIALLESRLPSSDPDKTGEPSDAGASGESGDLPEARL